MHEASTCILLVREALEQSCDVAIHNTESASDSCMESAVRVYTEMMGR